MPAEEFEEENKHIETFCSVYSFHYTLLSSKRLYHISFLKDEFSRLNRSSSIFVLLICSLNLHKIWYLSDLVLISSTVWLCSVEKLIMLCFEFAT